ncbi:DUF6352 family protein [Hwanghaeella sp.]|uniref:DUF6352 family protein n=1 Tax=Hwanghaeella sp. TaxID=2605943 RepID=UPI003CCC3314
MMDFWRTSGFHILERTPEGRLAVTDDYCRAFWRRPEVAPVDESCDAERALHAAMLETPTAEPDAARLAEFKDKDAADNFRILSGFLRDLKAAGTLEDYYLALFRGGRIAIPPLFIDQMAHALTRNVLDGVANPLQARAGELFFRSQRTTIDDGAIMMADEDTVEMYSQTGGFGDLGRLLMEGQTALREVTLDVLTEENCDLYWDRSDRFDTVLDITFPRPGLDALCRAMEVWIGHFLGLETRIHPVQSIRDERWRWHVGLDTTSTGILNALYNGEDVPEERMARLLSLFRLEIKDQALVLDDVAGKPVYLGLAMDETNRVQMKPQNLLVNLPLKTAG